MALAPLPPPPKNEIFPEPLTHPVPIEIEAVITASIEQFVILSLTSGTDE